MPTDLNRLKVLTDLDFNLLLQKSKEQIGYLPRKETTTQTYTELGFICGLEVHQQLLTKQKLFCRCPAGIYQKDDDFDAEVIRHMRPTLSELGEYDGTALMEFRTKKNIIYRLKNVTACTYEVDDTPPFKIDREALENALQIALQLKTKIVGELHITRKQYLDGSIPTGFQRTGIIGIEGEIPLKNKKVRIIQISLEEDSCREVSDIGHWRIYRTDRLGMPLIETVTYPDMKTPDEAAEAGYYISFLVRSSNVVRTGSGAARQDVNVSITGGHRVEIKGVSHINWIPELTHNEAFRQKALLQIKDKLNQVIDKNGWRITSEKIDFDEFGKLELSQPINPDYEYHIVKLPYFADILPYFTQPGQCFASELTDRLKVIACIEKPNLQFVNLPAVIAGRINPSNSDGVLLIWGPKEDMKTALETVEERCLLAFDGVPNETRKSFEDGTTIFERVLPGPDRMYPDTDTSPISITDDLISKVMAKIPAEVADQRKQLENWNIPADCHPFILRRNLVDMIDRISKELSYCPKFVGCLIGHNLKKIEGTRRIFFKQDYEFLYRLFEFSKNQKLDNEILFTMLPFVYNHPEDDMIVSLKECGYEETSREEIIKLIPELAWTFTQNKRKYPSSQYALENYLMGRLRKKAVGNIPLRELRSIVAREVSRG